MGGFERILTSVRWGRNEDCLVWEWVSKWASVRSQGEGPPSPGTFSLGVL